MKRRLLLILLAACLGLAACQGQTLPGNDAPAEKPADPTPDAPPTETPTEAPPETALPEVPEEARLGFDALDSGLIAWLRDNGLAEESFTVSPLSLKAALALTALGAEGETQRQLLDALGYQTVDELSAWYASVLVGVADFDGRIGGADKKDTAYRVVNAIFHNTACDGEFRESYKELVARTLAAEASSCSAQEIPKRGCPCLAFVWMKIRRWGCSCPRAGPPWRPR